MSHTLQRLLAVLGIALVAILLVGFAIATDSWGSMGLLVVWLGFGWWLVHRSVRRG